MLVIKADREKALVVLNLEKLVQLIASILTKTTEKATDKPPHNPLQTTAHQEPHSRLERRTLQALLQFWLWINKPPASIWRGPCRGLHNVRYVFRPPAACQSAHGCARSNLPISNGSCFNP